MNIFKRFRKVSDLETIEEKSFWMVAPIIALIGLAGILTSGSYATPIPTIVSAMLCLVFPSVLMVVVLKNKNYHVAYPLLCISTGAVCIPATFVFSGGFLSGMPLFCAITTGITALCYSKRWRIISVISCAIGNTAAFLLIYHWSSIVGGLPATLDGVENLLTEFNMEYIRTIYEDVMFGYYTVAAGLFFTINYITNDIRKYKLNQDTLQQFFDSEKRKEIIKMYIEEGQTQKTVHRNVAILFADISNFTPITEKMSSDLISEFLNEFFSIAGNFIHQTGGIIDKFIGDCIMAYWFDKEGENCVLNAVQSMINLRLEIMKRSEQIYEKYGTELSFSVGISYGDAIFGDIGSDSMHDFTVIGDAVNTASRIQNFAVGGEMLISDYAAEMIKKDIILEQVEQDHFFKGKNRPIDLYRIIGLATTNVEDQVSKKDILGYKLYICGCRGSFPVSGIRFSEYGGETSCYVIKKNDYAVIIDCGTGLKNAMEVIKDCSHVDILLTHVHYDHILGLLMSKFPSGTKIRIFGRFNAWKANHNVLSDFMEHPYWPVEIMDTDKIEVMLGEEYTLDEDMTATFYRSDHPDDACVIKVMCGNRKVVFLADCENAESLDRNISVNAEIVFFDGMFDDNDVISHKNWGHGTWQDGVRYLNGKNIKKLVITHHNPEMGDHSLMIKETEAREMAQNVSFAKSWDIFNI